MTVSEYFKLQAKLLEWEAPNGFYNKLKGYEKDDCMWVMNGVVIARIPLVSYMLNVPLLDGIKRFTQLPDEAVKGWLTETRFKDKNGVIDLDKAVRYIEFLKEAQGNEMEAEK